LAKLIGIGSQTNEEITKFPLSDFAPILVVLVLVDIVIVPDKHRHFRFNFVFSAVKYLIVFGIMKSESVII